MCLHLHRSPCLSVTGVKDVPNDHNPTKAVGPDLVHDKILTVISHVIAENLFEFDSF